ncbi:hypothetical protein GCM10009425_48790 [Pseudomonas asuensis]|uniref:Uncharacterized protein n=1 Tax=Pseudomonas asuensis TaxID=1825787 RepID=A0ABQ2H4V8_9PSED|nr:hypothetical protein GCM10009425_48790 [Pseudomonas asuensis]
MKEEHSTQKHIKVGIACMGAQGGLGKGDLCRVLQGFVEAENAAQAAPRAVQRPV